MMKLSLSDRLLEWFCYLILAMLSVITVYTFWNSFVISFNSGLDTATGGLTVWPRAFTLDNYKAVFQDPAFFRAMGISVARAVAGTTLSIFFTAMFGYGMSRRELPNRKFYMILSLVTMYFGGGLIPTYLLIRDLHMLNTFWVLIVPGMVSVYNMIIFRTFFMELPAGLEESAKLDGCSTFGIFFRIVIPVSGPVIATLSLFTAVGLWNDWFNAGIYMSNVNKLPVQNYLLNVLNSSNYASQMAQMTGISSGLQQTTVTGRSLQMATLMVSTLPIVLVYPFIQKYFVKGVLVGSLKG
ncbi:carbohydrate ABC transporter permease [Paenibacillus roseipurpureus]|uniref:Carbohydrate ABC transporter permease n=1 Tax=Paenibacillus roseopurpureus TaxID=2918901 RepID=A0AA96LVV7_9BACL|nr:carbohydrate ABC transporter permease [Paenibacillus sp. MBLB1832]WNR47049.1 carbohydrate ABC transporter permease [Paenibacillus sp. MBLB1832]